MKAEQEEKNLTDGQMESFADIIAQSFALAMKEHSKTEYVPNSSKIPPLGVTGISLPSGLEVRWFYP